MKTLKNDKTITLRNADKGAALVIMHTNDYIFEALTQLADTQFYRAIPTPIYPETSKLILNIFTALRNSKVITKRQFDFLKPPPEPRPRHFYTLPKIHKSPETWCIPHLVPKGRPIVSGCSSEAIGAEKYIDYFLKPLAQSQPSYLRDTTHFKSVLLDIPVTPESLLATMDVSSLYTMIDTSDGIRAVSHFFDRHPDPARPDRAILHLLRICLARNDFAFGNLWFLQIKGTAMGRIFAPNYACLFMSRWEEATLNAALSANLAPSFYRRYIDDIFLVFNHPAARFPNLLTILNNHDANIQLTASCSTISVDFLDTTVFKNDGRLLTRLFSKPTDTHLLLHKGSFHPPHTFKGIVRSQILRFARLCDLGTDFSSACSTLRTALSTVGYSRSFFNTLKMDVLRTLAWPPNPTGLIIRKGFSPCGSARAKCCAHAPARVVIRSQKAASACLVTQSLSCTSTNVIYGISCAFCDPELIIYVGQTKNSLRDRLNNHKSDISLGLDKPIARHFTLPGHNKSVLRICALEQTISTKLDSKEATWIHRLGTSVAPGLNCQDTVLVVPLIPLVTVFNPNLGPWFTTASQLATELGLPFKPLRASRRHPNLQTRLAPTKLKTNLNIHET